MKILFTSDLDRTLIFSERTKLNDIEYVCIEQLEDRDLSYMSKITYNLLRQLQTEIEFIPVTTRSLKQYERITIFNRDILPDVAIVANGGTILRKGIVDNVWKKQIVQKMSTLSLKREHLRPHFYRQFNASYIGNVHEVDDLFFVLIVDVDTVVHEDLLAFKTELECYGWTCYLQGKKLYVLPQFLTKGAAVDYVKSEHSFDWHVAAGDSQLDLSMLNLADTSFIPAHAELAEMVEVHKLPITNYKSSNFSDYCLRNILNKMNI